MLCSVYIWPINLVFLNWVIKTILPSNTILKKYIECFYFYEGVKDSSFSYLAFPHFNSGLSFFKGASIQRKNFCLDISEDINAGN